MKSLHLFIAAGLEVPQQLGGPQNFGDLVSRITNGLLTIAGAAAVIMIIVGGLQYTLSAGDDKRTKTAKDTITYAVVGLIITILAFAIVNFILFTFK